MLPRTQLVSNLSPDRHAEKKVAEIAFGDQTPESRVGSKPVTHGRNERAGVAGPESVRGQPDELPMRRRKGFAQRAH